MVNMILSTQILYNKYLYKVGVAAIAVTIIVIKARSGINFLRFFK
jgi:hypothetical protein